MSTLTDVDAQLAEEVLSAFDDLWAVVVHDDDRTTFEAVITALVELFGHTQEAAERLAWQVHTEGRAVVALLERERALAGARDLGRYGVDGSAEPA